jgi:predicted TIM-barrel fold metal-dependent hydrolase
MRCDSHIHVVGPPERYPQVPERTYLAEVAPLGEIERIAAARDVGRFVIVQPSFYGTDNTLLLESLDALKGRGRGVAVIEPGGVSNRELLDFATRGVRGLRVNLYSALGDTRPLPARFAAQEKYARPLEWHIELIAPLRQIVQEHALIAGARVPVVIDHYGLYSGFVPHRGEGRILLDLIRLPHVWIKLSAPYRSSYDPLATRADPIWLAEILKAASDRCVWGSDWPHTPPQEKHAGPDLVAPNRPLRYESVFDEFHAAVGSSELAERILTDNPARLYGF